MTQVLEDTIQRTVERLVAEFQPMKVYLFGSVAEGSASRHSDIDLMIVLSDLPDSPTRLARRGYRALRGLCHPTDLLFRSEAAFAQRATSPVSLEHQVLHHGRCLYGG